MPSSHLSRTVVFPPCHAWCSHPPVPLASATLKPGRPPVADSEGAVKRPPDMAFHAERLGSWVLGTMCTVQTPKDENMGLPLKN